MHYNPDRRISDKDLNETVRAASRRGDTVPSSPRSIVDSLGACTGLDATHDKANDRYVLTGSAEDVALVHKSIFEAHDYTPPSGETPAMVGLGKNEARHLIAMHEWQNRKTMLQTARDYEEQQRLQEEAANAEQTPELVKETLAKLTHTIGGQWHYDRDHNRYEITGQPEKMIEMVREEILEIVYNHTKHNPAENIPENLKISGTCTLTPGQVHETLHVATESYHYGTPQFGSMVDFLKQCELQRQQEEKPLETGLDTVNYQGTLLGPQEKVLKK